MHGMIGTSPRDTLFKWDVDNIEILRQRRIDNVSFSVIAAELGTTRDSCIGKAHRLGLCGTKADCGKPKIVKARAPRVTGAAALPSLTPYFNPNARRKLGNVPPAPQSVHIDLYALTSTTCRFPTITNGEGVQLYCGAAEADLAGGKPYCPHHHRVAFIPAPKRPKTRTNAILHPSRLAFGG